MKKLIAKRRRWVTTWGCSSVGRAPALQAGGHGFESHHLQSKKNDTKDLLIEKSVDRVKTPFEAEE